MRKYWISLINLGLLFGSFSLFGSPWALGQSGSQDVLSPVAHSPVDCDGKSEGFHIPSLQSLLMMPLSRAGDRFEAFWFSGRVAGHADCRQNSSIQCDSWTESPSYVLDERPICAPKDPKSVNRSTIDRDEALASEWNAPVKIAPLRAPSHQTTRQELASIATVDTNIRLASSTSDPKGVKITSVSQATTSMSEPKRSGEIKEKHLQRKRPEPSVSAKK